jgi:hypothetical protein
MNAETKRAATRRIEEAQGPAPTDVNRQQTDQGEGTSGRAGNATSSEEETTVAETGSGITGNRHKDRRKPRRSRMKIGYKQQLKPILERLLGQLELALMGRMEEVESRRTEEEWSIVNCPAIVQLFVNKQREFARFLMAATNQDETVGAVMKLQGN